jgi:hypothetical protein
MSLVLGSISPVLREGLFEMYTAFRFQAGPVSRIKPAENNTSFVLHLGTTTMRL